ncbi:hypothetical protein Aduo_018659 [Ancylostoma duodenale]
MSSRSGAKTKSTAEKSMVSQLKAILKEKAPRILPLLDHLMKVLKPDLKGLVEVDKSSHLMVLSAVPGAPSSAHAAQRQPHTESDYGCPQGARYRDSTG